MRASTADVPLIAGTLSELWARPIIGPPAITLTVFSSSYSAENTIDGNIDNYVYTRGDTASGNQCLIIDLGAEYDLDEITVWHYWNDNRVYYDNITYTAGNEQAWDIVMDEIIPESVNGKTVTAYNDDPVGYVESNLVVWYDGIQNTGTTRSSSTTTWKDLSGTGKNGTLYSGTSVNSNPTWGTNYLALDGDDWVSIAALNYENPTIEVVFSADTAKTTEMDLVVNYEAGGYGIQITNSQLIAVVNVGGTYYKLYEDVDINTKYYAALTYLTMSANVSYKQTLYFNGQNSGYNTLSGPIKSPDNNTIMTVGVNPVGSSPQASYFDGNIYAVRIYDRALTDEEIARNYQVDKARFGL